MKEVACKNVEWLNTMSVIWCTSTCALIDGSPSLKLSKRFYGPYAILENIGIAAYNLDFPPPSKLHLVFPCSLLQATVASAELPSSAL